MNWSWLVLCWAASCGDDAASESLDGRTFLLDSSKGFEPVENTTVRLRFHDGQLSLQADCNTHAGEYAVRDGVLIFENVGSTEIGCEPALQKQDEQLVEFLTSEPQLDLDDERLTLTQAKIELVFLDREVADPDRPLVGTLWAVDTLIDGDSASNLPLTKEPTIQFDDDDKLHVDTTCNTGSGRYQVDGARITLEDVSYTEVACSGASGSVETHIQAVLRDGTLMFEIDAARLRLERGSKGLGALARE
ncbi:MAG TPA: META domain-containing protein [Polyangiales bacterium]|nr:META domain-containing protein [Polyangiales bacterium]